jgi:hypothetical protein
MYSMNSNELKTAVFSYLDIDAIKAKMGVVGDASFNPFKLDANGKPIGFEETVIKAPGMVVEIAKAVCIVIEKIATDAKGVITGGEKKDALVNFLDDCIRLPFFLEPFDGPVIGFIIDKVIDWLNKTFGNGWLSYLDLSSTIVKSDMKRPPIEA